MAAEVLREKSNFSESAQLLQKVKDLIDSDDQKQREMFTQITDAVTRQDSFVFEVVV